MHESSALQHRRYPRFVTRHPVQATTQDGRLTLPGLLCDLSQEGCGLRLDGRLGPGTPVEVRCDISGLSLCLRGEIVWADPPGGLHHGVAITGFASEADARFHRQYLERLESEASIPWQPPDKRRESGSGTQESGSPAEDPGAPPSAQT